MLAKQARLEQQTNGYIKNDFHPAFEDARIENHPTNVTEKVVYYT